MPRIWLSNSTQSTQVPTSSELSLTLVDTLLQPADSFSQLRLVGRNPDAFSLILTAYL